MNANPSACRLVLHWIGEARHGLARMWISTGLRRPLCASSLTFGDVVVQTSLNKLRIAGTPLAFDGNRGRGKRAAVRAFQQSVDSLPRPKTVAPPSATLWHRQDFNEQNDAERRGKSPRSARIYHPTLFAGAFDYYHRHG
jgi:hypothetical protein